MISTIPFDRIFEKIISNTILSNLNTQVIKLVRTFKVFKLLRFGKFFSFYNFNYVFGKTEIGKEILLVVKRSIGIFELIKSMLILVVITHF